MSVSDFQNEVYEKLKQVPKGKVVTYQELAQSLGKPSAARAVGNALNKNPFAPKVPCHRVVKSDRSIGGYAHGSKKKIAILEKEGIKIEKEKIPKQYFYKFR